MINDRLIDTFFAEPGKKEEVAELEKGCWKEVLR